MVKMVPMLDIMGLSLFMSLKHLYLEFVSDFDIWISSLFSATKNTKIIVKIPTCYCSSGFRLKLFLCFSGELTHVTGLV